MALADVRTAIETAVLGTTPGVEPSLPFTRHAQQDGPYEAVAASRARAFRVRTESPPAASRWTRGAGVGVATVTMLLEIAYPASAWLGGEDADHAMADDIIRLAGAVGAPAAWSGAARNLFVRPEPQRADIYGEGDAVLTTIATLSIGVEYATGA